MYGSINPQINHLQEENDKNSYATNVMICILNTNLGPDILEPIEIYFDRTNVFVL